MSDAGGLLASLFAEDPAPFKSTGEKRVLDLGDDVADDDAVGALIVETFL